MKEQIVLNVSISPQEARDLIVSMSDDITSKSDKEAWLSLIGGPSGTRSFQHQANEERVFVQKRARFQSSWYGAWIRFEPRPFGSSLIAVQSLEPWTKGFFRLWFGGVGLLGGFGAISIIYGVAKGQRPVGELVWLLVPAGMITFGLLLIALADRFAKEEVAEIWGWLNSVFADVMVYVNRDEA